MRGFLLITLNSPLLKSTKPTLLRHDGADGKSITAVAQEVLGTLQMTYQGEVIDLTPP